MYHVSSCTALCTPNSFQTDCETPSNSIDSNACTISSRKKVSKNFQLNNCKYKRQQKAEYRKQYRICTQSPKKRQNKINFKEILEQLKHVHRKKQNAMITKEIIDLKTSSTPVLRKKQNIMNTKEITVLLIFLLSY